MAAVTIETVAMETVAMPPPLRPPPTPNYCEKKLKSLGFESFNTRNLNQDPLKIFFGNVRSHDFRSNKSTCFQFESIFKSLLITNLTSKHSPGFNCEVDEGHFLRRDCTSLLSGTEYLPLKKAVDHKEIAKENGTGNECEILEKSHL